MKSSPLFKALLEQSIARFESKIVEQQQLFANAGTPRQLKKPAALDLMLVLAIHLIAEVRPAEVSLVTRPASQPAGVPAERHGKSSDTDSNYIWSPHI